MATTGVVGLWEHLVATYHPFAIKFAGHAIVTICFWWIPCAVFCSLDYIVPSFSTRHKTQPKAKQPTSSQVLHSALIALRNDLLSAPLYLGLAYAFASKDLTPSVRVTAELPSPAEFAREFLLAFALREIMFYYGHRLYHWRPLYKRFHRIHHEFSAPVAFASKYAHPLEYLTADALPVILPPLLLRIHVVSMWVYMAGVLFSSTVIHSGYDFFHEAARMHDRHHEGAMNVYFGAWGAQGMMDWVHGTVEMDSGKRDKKVD